MKEKYIMLDLATLMLPEQRKFMYRGGNTLPAYPDPDVEHWWRCTRLVAIDSDQAMAIINKSIEDTEFVISEMAPRPEMYKDAIIEAKHLHEDLSGAKRWVQRTSLKPLEWPEEIPYEPESKVNDSKQANQQLGSDHKLVWMDTVSEPKLDTLIAMMEILCRAGLITVYKTPGRKGISAGVPKMIERVFCYPDGRPISAKSVSDRKKSDQYKREFRIQNGLCQVLIGKLRDAAGELAAEGDPNK